ncbi:hypothetical protein PRIPAC_92886 [Pristionchus pacificus]|uniref:Uncharacterized protein n=1 Tax=Pristionchus pacificus TaxID=54126 RepID=A0A2A6BPA0_PRIPA|nr:hypothetical protein PRIPAC_92886 [Pristionchus pacificus]|eukprot:PDM67737.1 hypothetical protein PRIPAC_45781 [Pristionchus pacificus]
MSALFSRMENMGEEKDDERIVKEVVETIVGRVTNDTKWNGETLSIHDKRCVSRLASAPNTLTQEGRRRPSEDQRRHRVR